MAWEGGGACCWLAGWVGDWVDDWVGGAAVNVLVS